MLRSLCLLTILLLTSCARPSSSRLTAEAPELPLKTQGRFIVDQSGKRVKLRSINWYGASDQLHVNIGLHRQHRDALAKSMIDLGFNSVRLPFSNEMLSRQEPVPADLLAANPDLIGLRPLEVFDALVDSMSQAGLLVILNNHTSKGQWCCSQDDNDGLWFNDNFTEKQWIADWLLLAERYKNNPYVIGADLRNELRENRRLRHTPNWGKGDANDWRLAAQKAGNALLKVNPELLIFVEGLDFAVHLEGVYQKPVKLDVPNKLVYSVHSYHFFGNPSSASQSYETTSRSWGQQWGYILAQGKSYTAPVWVGEFGVGLGENRPGSVPKLWWNQLLCYMQNADIDFAYWALNGEKLQDSIKPAEADLTRTYQNESYGLVDSSWNPIAGDWRVADIKRYLGPTREGPGAGQAPYEALDGCHGGP